MPSGVRLDATDGGISLGSVLIDIDLLLRVDFHWSADGVDRLTAIFGTASFVL